MRWTRVIVLATVCLVALGGIVVWRLHALPGLHAAGRAASRAPAQREIPVNAATAETRDVPIYIEGLGTVQAFNTVAVKTRVDGRITKVFFKEGQDVKAGDPLFQIDPRPFEAALQQAQANKEKDEAQLQSAQLDLERYAKLLPSGFQTRQSYDQQKGTVGQLQAAVKADQAQIENAQHRPAKGRPRKSRSNRTECQSGHDHADQADFRELHRTRGPARRYPQRASAGAASSHRLCDGRQNRAGGR
jgi:multidrug efflux system membrane fusion protein